MTTTRSKPLTWAQVRAALTKTMGLAQVALYRVESQYEGARATEQRKAGRAPQTVEQRTVRLIVDLGSAWARRGAQRHIRMDSSIGDTALDNLDRLQRAFETIRLTTLRGLDTMVVRLYRQMYPAQTASQQQTQTQQTPPHSTRARVEQARASAAPYAALHVAPDAPLEVAEAAYRALVKAAHPDVGGDHTRMLALNAAIETIRKRHETR